MEMQNHFARIFKVVIPKWRGVYVAEGLSMVRVRCNIRDRNIGMWGRRFDGWGLAWGWFVRDGGFSAKCGWR